MVRGDDGTGGICRASSPLPLKVFPMQVRGKAVSLVVFVNRLLSGLIATSFLR